MPLIHVEDPIPEFPVDVDPAASIHLRGVRIRRGQVGVTFGSETLVIMYCAAVVDVLPVIELEDEILSLRALPQGSSDSQL